MNTFYGIRSSKPDALQRRKRPVLAARSRDDGFLAMLGHEMRNPLSALSNALELWPSTMPDALQMDELRSLMLRQVEQLVRFSEDLVSEARGDHALTFRRDQVDLKRIVESACEEVRPFALRRGHTLTLNTPADPIVVSGDALRLIQAFANLVQNAAKFMERNGCFEVTVDRQGEWATVRVRDNGRGIESHRLPLIFGAHPERVHEYGLANDGLGIGLPLVKRIVEEHGGNITALSDGPGQGSAFTVFLPIQSAVLQCQLPLVPPLAVGNNGISRQLRARQIMVVDDHQCLAGLLAKMLRSLGQAVTISNDGAAAIEIAREMHPEIVLLDIVMCGLDGYEVARRLRKIPALDGVRLVAVSGRSDERSKRLALEAGFDDYLVKPVSMSELVILLECTAITAPFS